MIQLSNDIINSSQAPDLIFTEINVTDSVQHKFGYASSAANFAVAFADMLVGLGVHNLKKTGRDSEYSIIVTSDHGHADTKQALFVDNIVDHPNWHSECAVLFLRIMAILITVLMHFKHMASNPLTMNFFPKTFKVKFQRWP